MHIRRFDGDRGVTMYLYDVTVIVVCYLLYLSAQQISGVHSRTTQSDRKVIRVTTVVGEPYVMAVSNSCDYYHPSDLSPLSSPHSKPAGEAACHVVYTGFIIDLLDRLSQMLNFDFVITEVRDGQYGHYDKRKGNWTGMIGELLREEVDISAAPLFITPARNRVVAFTRSFLSVYATMVMMKMPSVYPSSGKSPSSQSQRSTSSSSSNRKLEVSDTPVTSVEDLIRQSEIKYGTLDTGIFVRLFQMSNDSVLSRMWRNMQGFKRAGYDVLMQTNQQGIAKARQERYAYILPNTIADYVVNRAPCNLVTVDNFLHTKGYGLALKDRDNPLLAELNIALDSLDEEGFLDALYYKWWREKGDCSSGMTERSGSKWALISRGARAHCSVSLVALTLCIACKQFMTLSL